MTTPTPPAPIGAGNALSAADELAVARQVAEFRDRMDAIIHEAFTGGAR